ncbi:hypothetical protein PWP93_21305 [Paraburkholderia sp. A1RI-2L]|uniref:hypothetical protein n=1 Tax=Paraburkholderia sp. A1RI-2L TaxID=3028367 RepID=UPI003B7FAE36
MSSMPVAGIDVGGQKKGCHLVILQGAGILLMSIDDVDAALCALTAGYLLAARTDVYGDAKSGDIRVPRTAGHECLIR